MALGKALTIATIRALPGRHMTARCTWGEYRVSFLVPEIMLANDCTYNEAVARNEAVACYTDCPQDALDTARYERIVYQDGKNLT